jgi:hypothetical protein
MATPAAIEAVTVIGVAMGIVAATPDLAAT